MNAAEAMARYAVAYAEEARRYGTPQIDPTSGEVVWHEEGATVSWNREEGARQFTMKA